MESPSHKPANVGEAGVINSIRRRGHLARLASARPLTVFFVLAYGFSWLIALPMALFRWPIELTIAVSFGPTLAAILTHWLTTGSFRAFRFYTTATRTFAAAVIGSLLVVLSYVVLPGVITADPAKLNWGILTSLTVYNYSTLLGGPLGEEPGWRGYALPCLEARFGPLWGSIVLASLWVGWHLPLFLIPGWTTSPLWIYALIVIGVSLILTLATNLACFAIIPAIVIHSVFNTVSRFLNGLFVEVQPSSPIRFELVLVLCGLAVGVLLVALTRGQLAYPERGTAVSR